MSGHEPVDCCGPADGRGSGRDPRVARRFDREWGEWHDADGFPPMVHVSARLLDRLRDAPLAGPTVLEIGCGVGAVSTALLEMGARAVKGVDLSAESVDLARRRVAAAGLESRAEFAVGHGADVRGEVYDWVILDRVVCCDGQPDHLLDAVLAAARGRVAITAPESRGWRGLLNRPLWAAENVWDLMRGGCRGYVHDLRRVERRLFEAGFRLSRSDHIDLWFVGVYDRA
ncbi:MAG: methyltransferase domain-containing protein [Chloroflexota bacterium]|nr:methyltransferase domain-containing protein [Chloroflexota bacterium]